MFSYEGKYYLIPRIDAQALQTYSDIQIAAVRTAHGQSQSVAAAIGDGLEQRIIGTVTGRDVVLVLAQDDEVGRKVILEISVAYHRFR